MGIALTPARFYTDQAKPHYKSGVGRMILSFVLLLLPLLLPAQQTQPATKPLPKWEADRKMEKIYNSGMTAFQAQEYDKAAKYFELALDKETHNHYIVSLYMAGLSQYYLNNYAEAIGHFQKLLINYPGSPYQEEAQLHKGLMMLTKADKQSGGLFVLMNLAAETKKTDIKAATEAHINNFLFYEAELTFLEEYYKIVRPSYKAVVIEAVCLRLYNEGRTDALKKYLEEYMKANNGQLSTRLQKLRAGGGAGVGQKTKLRVAVVLPFEMMGADTTLKDRAVWAFDLLAGMQLALQNEKFPYFTQIELRVWDSNKSKERTEQLLKTEIQTWKPDAIVGEIYNSTSRAIAEWAETNNVLHIIPLSPSESLVQDKKNAYLANPTYATTLQSLARFAQKRGIRNVLILKSTNTDLEYTEDFVGALGTGAKLKMVNIEDTKPEVLSNMVASGGYDALYIPIAEEEKVHSYVNQLREDGRTITLLGLPEWSVYNKLNKQMLSQFITYIADAYAPRADSVMYNKVRTQHLAAYKNIPNIYVFQGYDIIRLVVRNMARAMPYTRAEQVMLNAPAFRGINQTYTFGTQHSNQSVNILRFENGNLKKVE